MSAVYVILWVEDLRLRIDSKQFALLSVGQKTVPV